jgi:hypothetical protein
MFIIEKLTVHTSEDKQRKDSLSQFSTLPVTLKLVPCMTTTRRHHLLGIDSIKFLKLFLGIVLHSFATFGRVDRGSEVEVVAGAHVYPAHPIGVQWDSSPAIWKAMVAH